MCTVTARIVIRLLQDATRLTCGYLIPCLGHIMLPTQLIRGECVLWNLTNQPSSSLSSWPYTWSIMFRHFSSSSAALLFCISTLPTAAGDIVCRYTTTTSALVNYYTCTELANFYGITVPKFLQLNPVVDEACSNIKANTEYCVAGCTYSKILLFRSIY